MLRLPPQFQGSFFYEILLIRVYLFFWTPWIGQWTSRIFMAIEMAILLNSECLEALADLHQIFWQFMFNSLVVFYVNPLLSQDTLMAYC